MATLEKAIELAARYHAGQRDKEWCLATSCIRSRRYTAVRGEQAMIVAVLHDTIEDTSLTEADLREAGFGDDILAAVRLVTHAKGVGAMPITSSPSPRTRLRGRSNSLTWRTTRGSIVTSCVVSSLGAGFQAIAPLFLVVQVPGRTR